MGLDRGHVHTTCTFSVSEVKNTAENVAAVQTRESNVFFFDIRGERESDHFTSFV